MAVKEIYYYRIGTEFKEGPKVGNECRKITEKWGEIEFRVTLSWNPWSPVFQERAKC